MRGTIIPMNEGLLVYGGSCFSRIADAQVEKGWKCSLAVQCTQGLGFRV